MESWEERPSAQTCKFTNKMLDETVPSFRWDVKAEGPWLRKMKSKSQLQLKKTNTYSDKKDTP